MVKAFAKAGIYPIKYDAIPDQAIALSLVTCDLNIDTREPRWDFNLPTDSTADREDHHTVRILQIGRTAAKLFKNCNWQPSSIQS